MSDDIQPKEQESSCYLSWFWRLAALVAIFASVPTVLGFFGRMWYRFEWMSHFRVQYVFGLLPFVIVFLIAKRWRSAIVPGVCVLLNLCLIVPLYIGTHPASTDSRTIKAVSINLLTANREYDRVIDFVRETDPDIVLLIESSQRWLDALEPLNETYPYRINVPRGDNFGMALFSRFPFESQDWRLLDPSSVPIIQARMSCEGKTFTVIGAHPMPPVSAMRTRERDQFMKTAAEMVHDAGTPVVFLGDLNATSWSYCFRDFVKAAGLSDSRKGFGVQTTWPTDNSLLRVSIDHCLVSDEIAVHQRAVGPFVGSDHLPIFIEFSVK